MNYQEYVRAAKKLVGQIDCYQGKVAEYAMAVCQIRHGGRSEGFYTLTDFADDIGITAKKLSRWVGIYKMSLSVGIEKPTSSDWTIVSKMKTMQDMHVASLNHESSTPGKKIKPIIDNKENLKIFNKLKNGRSDEYEFAEFVKFIQRKKNILKNLDLNKIDDRAVVLLMDYLDELSDTLNDFLTEKRDSSKKFNKTA